MNVNLSTKGFEKGSQRVKEAVRSMSDKANDMGKSTESAMSKVGKGFSAAGNMAKSFSQTIKNSIKTIIGIGTAYQIISKSVSAYMSQNQKLSQQMNSVWTAFGNLLGPIIERIIGLVTSAVSYLLSFMKLLGLTSKSASQLSKSAKGAGGAMQATVAGFDELNKLQDSGGGGGGGGGLEDKDPTEWMKKIQELIAGKKWEELGKEIGKKVTEFIVGIPHKISELIKKVDWKEVGRAIVGIIKGFFEGFDVGEILDSLVTLAHDIWNAFLDLLWGMMEDESGEEPPLVKSLRALGDAFVELYETIKKAWNDDIKPVLIEVYESYIEPILDKLINEWLPWLIDKITTVVEWLAEHESIVVGVLTAIGAAIAAIGIGKAITALIGTIWKLGGALKAVWAIIAANPIVAIIAVVAGLVAAFIHAYQTNDEFREKVDKAWAAIKNAIGTAVDWVKDKFQAFKDKIAEVRQKIIDFKDKAVESFNNIKTKVTEMWNKIKEVFSFKWELPHIKLPHLEVTWQPAGDLAKFFGFSHVPSIGINWYKKGGIIDGARLIGAGEDGKEAIIPLERNTEWINMVADGLIKRLEANESKIGTSVAALRDIANTVAFKMPVMANGTVLPYSVSASSGGMSSAEADSEILKLIEMMYELLERFVTGMDNMQFVAEFEDIRALAKKITKEQRRQTISEGM